MKIIFLFLFLLLFLTFSLSPASAIYQPATRPNNKLGIHILFPSELSQAAKLVNSTGGDWGYVTIPIQYGDRDIEKWQSFMNDAARYHLIPIIRIATEPYHANTNVWRKPNDYDIVDFANFLNSLSWPTKNRYVLLFNEVNRFDEWGGDAPDPAVYADFVSDAVDAFKARNSDFFVIAGGLDNASPNDGVKYLDNFVYLRKMAEHNPEVFSKIDGFSSHSYPNPNFAEAPSKTRLEGTSTYKFETDLIKKYGGNEKPVFITETGWNAEALPGNVIAAYYKMANKNTWQTDDNIVAVTPFLLESQGGSFNKFSFIKDNNYTPAGLAYHSISKIKGEPLLNAMPIEVAKIKEKTPTPEKFAYVGDPSEGLNFSSKILRTYFKTILGLIQ